MLTTLIVCLCLGTNLHAGSIAPSIFASTPSALVNSIGLFADGTTSPSPFDMNLELEKLATTCLTTREHELLSGDILKDISARTVNVRLIPEAQQVIGLAELRDVLGFAPLGPWTNYNYTEPSEEELAAAPTVEAYYTLREPSSEIRSLDSLFFYEKNFTPAIAFLNKRIPAIRTIYRRKFEEIRRRPDAKVIVDRKEVDRMIDGFINITQRIYDTISPWKPCKLRVNKKTV